MFDEYFFHFPKDCWKQILPTLIIVRVPSIEIQVFFAHHRPERGRHTRHRDILQGKFSNRIRGRRGRVSFLLEPSTN